MLMEKVVLYIYCVGKSIHTSKLKVLLHYYMLCMVRLYIQTTVVQ